MGEHNSKSGIVELVQFKSSTETNDELLHGLVVATTSRFVTLLARRFKPQKPTRYQKTVQKPRQRLNFEL